MKNNRLEENTIIAINSMKKIMLIFLGPFLTAYFIKTSQESMVSLSIYYILSYGILGIGTFFVANIIKNKFRVGMFRIGVIVNIFYIMSIIILKENIIHHLGLIAILYGVSSAIYWLPYNLFVINKIDNNERTRYTVKSSAISSTIGILCPLILGSIITVTNFELTALIILFISAIQIILSFILKPENENDLPQFELKNTWKKLKDNKQIRKMFAAEFFIGMNVSIGALDSLMTILIFNSFKTDMNLGIITSLTTVLSIISVRAYGRMYKMKDDKKLIMVASILPVISVFILLVYRTNITVIIYNICYVVFTTLLQLTRDIRLFNLSDSYIVDKNSQCEFFSIREGILNLGRMTSYLMLLLAGLSGNQTVLNIIMVLLTLSIVVTGLNIRKIDKFEK